MQLLHSLVNVMFDDNFIISESKIFLQITLYSSCSIPQFTSMRGETNLLCTQFLLSLWFISAACVQCDGNELSPVP
jgi:hypothetical protein